MISVHCSLQRDTPSITVTLHHIHPFLLPIHRLNKLIFVNWIARTNVCSSISLISSVYTFRTTVRYIPVLCNLVFMSIVCKTRI